MKKILLIIIGLLLLYIGHYYYTETRVNRFQKKITNTAEKAITKKSAEICNKLPKSYKKPAIRNPQMSFSERSNYIFAIDECLVQYAKQINDPSICDLIIEEPQKNDCYWEYAKKTNDISWCHNMTRIREKHLSYKPEGNTYKCLSYIAKTHNDVSICDQIEHETVKKNCIKKVSNN